MSSPYVAFGRCAPLAICFSDTVSAVVPHAVCTALHCTVLLHSSACFLFSCGCVRWWRAVGNVFKLARAQVPRGRPRLCGYQPEGARSEAPIGSGDDQVSAGETWPTMFFTTSNIEHWQWFHVHLLQRNHVVCFLGVPKTHHAHSEVLSCSRTQRPFSVVGAGEGSGVIVWSPLQLRSTCRPLVR
jgi:hypothetical protein